MNNLTPIMFSTTPTGDDTSTMTVRDKLLAKADTQSDLDFIAMLMNENGDLYCARQRSRQEVGIQGTHRPGLVTA